MKFIHMADMHFDSAFVNLAGKENLAAERRMEQRKVMKDIIDYIKSNSIPYLFISGDLYEHEYVKRTTIEYINNLFKEIPQTKIYIVPGNHDPYIKNSFYNQYNWNDNVHIFTDRLEVIEDEKVDIYGYGFNDFYMKNNYQKINIKNEDKINILITHGSLDCGSDEEREYNLMSSKTLKETKFDYIALGHIHKKSYNDYQGQRIVYPGSTVSLGFDELEERGVILGDLDKNHLDLQFLEIKSKPFVEKELDITDINSEEELIEKINLLKLDNGFYKIVLIGKRDFDIDIVNILKLIENKNIIKLKNNSSIKYDIEEIASIMNLKGLFAKNILDKINKNNITNEEKEKLLEAFDIGMQVLK